MLVVDQVSLPFITVQQLYLQKVFICNQRSFAFISEIKGGHDVCRLVVEDKEQRERIVSSIHDPCHLGVNRTVDMIAPKYYWPGLTTDVKQYVSL